ncbi:MAG TPA: serine/threonine-protein kinase [Candidatus Omnitrophota bacterium]|jgi:serine/threonine protein kinase|nr:serine/threonine-protein kinase [Candidatus Omnitrophota bacterium]
MNETNPREGDPLHLAAAVADGAEIDWKRMESTGADAASVRSFELIDSVFRDYGKAAEEIRATLHAPLLVTDSKWGSLRVLEQIGAGSFGQVFRAFDRSLQRDVALKVLRDPPRSAAGVPEFLEEARRLARVRHPGVLTVYGVSVQKGRAGIWTELVRGRTLEEILESDGPFAPEEAARIGIELCSALSAIHAAGLIHTDVKTENVLREDGGRVVLADFGAMDDRFDEDGLGSGFGSLLSVAPEILRGARPTPASDVYSLGVLLYRLLTGRYPFLADSPRDLLLALERGRTPLAEARPGIPGALAAAVDRALEPDPGRRYGGPNAMAQALRLALDPTLPAKRAPAESYRPPGRDSMLAAIAACAVISALVATGIWQWGIPWLAHRFQGDEAGTTSTTSTTMPAGGDNAASGAATSGVVESPAPPASQAPAGLRSMPVLYRISEVGREPLADGATIRSGDALALAVETGPDPVTCYVLDEDEAGNDCVLFPLSGYRARNPIPAGTSQVLPDGKGAKARAWAVDSENGRETLALITSLSELPWLESMLRDVPRSGAGDATPPPAPAPGLVTRGIGGTRPVPVTGKMAAILDRLRASEAFRSGRAGLWRIRLEAPPSP